jgi:spore coat protein U-like protein
MKLLRASLVLLSTLVLVKEAHAGSASTSFSVTAHVTNSCTIAASTLSFGNYDPTSLSPTPGSTTLQVNCTLGSSATIALDQGQTPTSGSTAAAPARQMVSGSDLLAYNLYQDSQHTIPWGAGVSAVDYSGVGVPTTVQIYGLIPQSQVIPSEDFIDSVTATVNF